MAEPIVKWIGGKGRLLPELVSRLPGRFKTYHEPFIGGGALFFAIRPRFAYLADANPELVNLYQCIKREPGALMDRLAGMGTDETEYYRLRGQDRDPGFADLSAVERAARFIYLNKCCFNGLYRVNRQGHFNAAWGKRRNPQLFDAGNVMSVQAALEGVRLTVADFGQVLHLARPGDFVYFDPPYDDSFTGYTSGSFSRQDQHRLWQLCVKLHRLGASWMLSNADTPFIRQLFRAFRVESVLAPRSVAASGAARAPAREVIVRNY